MSVSHAIAPLAALVFAGLFLWAGIRDVLTMQISNVLVLGLVLAFAVFAPLAGLTAFEIATAGAMALAVLLVGMGLFALGWLGGGDVKLTAAAALWLGAGHVPTFLTTRLSPAGRWLCSSCSSVARNCRRPSSGVPGRSGCTRPKPACPMAWRSPRALC